MCNIQFVAEEEKKMKFVISSIKNIVEYLGLIALTAVIVVVYVLNPEWIEKFDKGDEK